MPERPIRLFGDPVLKTVSAPVEQIDDRVRALVADLVDSVRLPGRAGVAASQIGVNLRVFSYNIDGDVGYVINPEIVEVMGDRELIDEGCLSVPGLWHKTPRHPFARVRGIDLDGNEIEVSGTGLMPIGTRLPKVRRIGIIIGEPLDFSRFEGMEGDRYILRSITDEIMVALQRLGEQEYDDVYASTVKDRAKAPVAGAPDKAKAPA